MTGQFGKPYCFLLSLFLALSAVSPARAQQGQYNVHYAPFTLKTMKSMGGLATYSPIKAVNGQTIQLRGDDGQVFSFTLDAETVYCQGSFKVSDWSYLRSVGRKSTVTVMTNDYTDKKALVVWDQAPSLSTSGGEVVFALPPMCK